MSTFGLLFTHPPPKKNPQKSYPKQKTVPAILHVLAGKTSAKAIQPRGLCLNPTAIPLPFPHAFFFFDQDPGLNVTFLLLDTVKL